MTDVLQNYVNGEWRSSSAPDYLDVVNPATNQVLAKVPMSSAAELDEAAQFAAEAFKSWRRVPPTDRVQYLFKLKVLMDQQIDDLAQTITLECGKTVAEAKGEMQRAIENVEVACGIPILMQGYNS